MAATSKSRTITKLLNTLEDRYGKKPKPPNWSSVDMLLFYIAYYYSGVTAARRVFKILREEYVDLNEVRVSNLAEIRATLGRTGADKQVAYELRGILKDVYSRENDVSLTGIDSLPADQVKRYFSQCVHIPPHAVDYLLLLKWGHPVLPVDGQITRMASRLGLVSSNSDAGAAQRSLMRNVKSNSYFDFYTLFLEHATKVCVEEPRCDHCILVKQCRHGKTASGKKGK